MLHFDHEDSIWRTNNIQNHNLISISNLQLVYWFSLGDEICSLEYTHFVALS